MWFGNVTASDTITIPWDVVSLQSGSVTPTTAGSIVIYKNNSATQRTSASGVTDTRTFDSVTGTNLLTIDLSDNTDAGFYAAGNNYHVMVSGMVVEGLTMNRWIGSFSIQNRNDYADIREIGGSAVSTTTAQLGVNVVNAGGTAWASGAITAGVFAADAITAAKVAADVTTELQSGLATAASIAALNNLSQADIRTAVGLASANLDTQLTAIDDYLDTEVAAIKAKTDQLTFTVANQVDSNIQYVNDVAVTGTGASGDEWGP